MTGLDILLALLLVIAVVVESIRGFGVSVLDLLAVYCAFLLTSLVAPSLAAALPGIGGTGANFADFYLISFVVLSIALLVGSHFAYSLLMWDVGVFDKFGGTIIGIALGIVFCHGIVTGLSLGDPSQVALESGGLSQQLLTFSTFHQMIADISKLTSPSRDSD